MIHEAWAAHVGRVVVLALHLVAQFLEQFRHVPCVDVGARAHWQVDKVAVVEQQTQALRLREVAIDLGLGD